MKLYTVGGTLLKSDAYFDLINNDQSNTIDYISYNEGKLCCLPTFRAQKGYSLNNINETDFYDSTRGNLQIYSERFYQTLSNTLANEMTFFPAEMLIGNEVIKGYIAKIINIQDIIDIEKSVIDYDDDDPQEEPFIETPVFKANLTYVNYAVKHKSDQPIIIYTEAFKQLVNQHGFNMRFNQQINE